MFNVTGGELLIILLVALIVLGPEKLPGAMRGAGRLYGELRKMATGFQAELRDVLDEPARELRSTADLMRSPLHDDPDPPVAADLRTVHELDQDEADAEGGEGGEAGPPRGEAPEAGPEAGAGAVVPEAGAEAVVPEAGAEAEPGTHGGAEGGDDR